MALLSNPSQLEVVNKVNELDTGKLDKLNNSEFTTYEGEIDVWKSTDPDIGGVGILSQNDQYMLVVQNQAGAFTDASGEIGLSFMPGATALMGKAYDTEEHKHSLVIDLDGIKADDSLILTESSPVLKYTQQTLTDEQKAQARTNLGVESVDTSKFVTTDTDQEISSIKNFNATLDSQYKLSNYKGIKLGSNRFIGIQSNGGAVIGYTTLNGPQYDHVYLFGESSGSYLHKWSIAIGTRIETGGLNSIAIGVTDTNDTIKAMADNAIQIGVGINSTAKTLQVWDYQLLDGNTGKIPDARLSDNIATVSDIPDVRQTTGTSTENVMSQDAVTKELTAITTALSNKFSNHARSNYNCNTCYDEGVYIIANGSNCPSGSQYGALLVMPYRDLTGNATPDFAVQIFIPNGDDSSKPNSMFYRTSLANSWNAWQELNPNAVTTALNRKADLYKWHKINVTYDATSTGLHTIDISSAISGWSSDAVYEVIWVMEAYYADTSYLQAYSDMFSNSYSDQRFSTSGRQGGRIYTLPCHRYLYYNITSRGLNTCKGAVVAYRRLY